MVWALNDGVIQILLGDAVRYWDWEQNPPCFESEIFDESIPMTAIIFPEGKLHLLDSSHEEYAMLLPEVRIDDAKNLPDTLLRLNQAFEDESLSAKDATKVVRELLL